MSDILKHQNDAPEAAAAASASSSSAMTMIVAIVAILVIAGIAAYVFHWVPGLGMSSSSQSHSSTINIDGGAVGG